MSGAVGVERLGPGERGPEDVGRVGRGEGDHRGLGAASGAGALGEGAQPVDGTGAAELRGAEALDEVAAAAASGVLEGAEHLVDAGEPTGDALADDRSAGDHAVALEEVLGAGLGAAGGVGVPLRQQRPASGGLGRAGARGHPATGGAPQPGRRTPGAVRGRAGADQRPERGEGVVGDQAAPDQVPQGGGELGVAGGADAVGELAEEPRTATVEQVEHRALHARRLVALDLGEGEVGLVGEVEADPAVAAGQRGVAGPDDLAGGRELVEHGGLVVAHACGEHQRLEGTGGHRAAGELVDGRHDPVHAAQGPSHALPGGQEAGDRVVGDRFDLLPQPGERTPAQLAQHLGVAPLGARAGRAELAVEHPAAVGESLEGLAGDGLAEAQAGGDLGGGERAVAAGVARDEVAERVLGQLEEGVGGADGDRHAEPVAQAADVLDGGPAVVPGHPDLHDTAYVGEGGHPALDVGSLDRAGADLLGRQRTDEAEQVGDGLGVAGPALVGEPLELGLHLGEHLGVEQLAQLGAAEELGEQALVERQRGGATLGDGGVALVDELGDVAEEQAAGEGARGGGGDVDDADLAALDATEEGDEGREVVDVLEALAHGLEDDREGGVLGRDLEQLGAALALLPQRAAATGVAARKQEGPRCALAEAAGEERGPADLLGDELLDLLGLEDDHLAGGRLGVGVGDADHDAVVGGHGLPVDVVALAQAGVDRQRPRGVDGRAVGGVDDQAPVAELVAEALHEDLRVVGDDLGGLALLSEVGDEVGGGVEVEAALAHARDRLRGRQRGELAGEGADGGTELRGTAEGIALPEGEPAGDPGRGGDQHPVVGDVLDPPARRAEGEDVADARLVDHLLVELADAAGLLPDEEDAEEATVGDGAAAGDRETLRAGPAAECAGDAVPDDARAQLGELVAGVAAAEQVEGGVEGGAGELGVGRGAGHEGVHLVDVPLVHRQHRHDLLGEHVEGVGGDRELLDGAAAHPLDRHGRLGEVATVLGEEDPAADLADLVAGAADALERARDAGRRLDLDDEVDRAHVDAELEAAGGDHAGQAPALEVVLDHRPLLLGDRPVVGLGDDRAGAAALPGLGHHLRRRPRRPVLRLVGALPLLGALGGDLVEPGREALGEAAGVGEDDGRAVLLDEVDDVLLDVGPDAGGATGVLGVLVVVAGHRHVLDGHHDAEVPLLGAGRGDDLDRLGAAEEARDLVERADGGAETDALGGLVEQAVEALEADAEVRAALGAGDGVDLVDDDRVDAAQRLARLAGQHQEERLGGRDEDVGRRGAELAAVGRAGVTRAEPDGDLGDGGLEPLGRVADAGEGGAEVALDIDAECLQRGDVEHARAPGLVVGTLGAEQPVDGVEEGAQRLAAAGGRDDERMVSLGDARPGALLSGRRPGERCLEPRPRGRAEAVEGGHALQSDTGVRHPLRPEGWTGGGGPSPIWVNPTSRRPSRRGRWARSVHDGAGGRGADGGGLRARRRSRRLRRPCPRAGGAARPGASRDDGPPPPRALRDALALGGGEPACADR